MKQQIYIAIDLKSFYASVECVERNLNPLTTHLVVADVSRTSKTICLAVSPSLKSFGLPGRARLFEVEQRVKELNAQRKGFLGGQAFSGSSPDAPSLKADPSLKLSYIIAPPQMARYIQVSSEIYRIYLKYIAPEDIHVYSIDEVFMDVTSYLHMYPLRSDIPLERAGELAAIILKDILSTTGITATAGIGTNLYLSKIAMDIVAKHVPPDEHGLCIASLDEISYRRRLWSHRPLTDFWRVGRGYARKLEAHGLYTMGDIAACSVGRPRDYHNEELLYQLFGINAELLIDHAWGWEPVTIDDIKSYKPRASSIGSGQVLLHPYSYEKAALIVKEMAEQLALQLVEKHLVANQLTLTVGYDISNLSKADNTYEGPVKTDHYGRKVPRHSHGTLDLPRYTSSSRLLRETALALFRRIANPGLLVRRITITANHVIAPESTALSSPSYEQLTIFTDYEALQKRQLKEEQALLREKKLQEAILQLRNKFGKNAVLKGMDLEEGATAMDRNGQIGGHRA